MNQLRFDRAVFEALPLKEVGEYASKVEASGLAGLRGDAIHQMATRIGDYDVLRQLYIALWAIELRISGAADVALGVIEHMMSEEGQAAVLREFFDDDSSVTLISRVADQGAQVTILSALLDADIVRREHIQRLEKMPTRVPSDVWRGYLDELERRAESGRLDEQEP